MQQDKRGEFFSFLLFSLPLLLSNILYTFQLTLMYKLLIIIVLSIATSCSNKRATQSAPQVEAELVEKQTRMVVFKCQALSTDSTGKSLGGVKILKLDSAYSPLDTIRYGMNYWVVRARVN